MFFALSIDRSKCMHVIWGCLAHEGEINDVGACRLDASFSYLLGIIPHRKKEIAQ